MAIFFGWLLGLMYEMNIQKKGQKVSKVVYYYV